MRIICDPFASAMVYVRMHQSELCVCTDTVSPCPLYILTKVVEFVLQDCGQMNPNSLVCHCLLPKPCYYFNSEAWRPQVVTLWIIARLTPGM